MRHKESITIVTMRIADVTPDGIPVGATSAPCSTCSHPVVVAVTSRAYMARKRQAVIRCTRCVGGDLVIDLTAVQAVPGAVEETVAHFRRRARAR